MAEPVQTSLVQPRGPKAPREPSLRALLHPCRPQPRAHSRRCLVAPMGAPQASSRGYPQHQPQPHFLQNWLFFTTFFFCKTKALHRHNGVTASSARGRSSPRQPREGSALWVMRCKSPCSTANGDCFPHRREPLPARPTTPAGEPVPDGRGDVGSRWPKSL